MVFICNFLAFALLFNSYFIIQWHRMCCVDMVFINDTFTRCTEYFQNAIAKLFTSACQNTAVIHISL